MTRRALVPLCALFFATALDGAPTQSTAGSAWVETTLKSLTLEAKAAQMLMVRAAAVPRHPDSPEQRELVALVRELGVGGVVLFRSELDSVPLFVDQLQAAAKLPLWFGVDVERSLGIRVPTGPVLAARRDGDRRDCRGEAGIAAARFAGELTARETRAAGIHWAFAPVADVNNESEEPDHQPALVRRGSGARGASWSRRTSKARGPAGVLTSAKHFPGHGDTRGRQPPRAARRSRGDRAELERVELAPFRAAIAAGVDSVMVGHLAVPALDASRNAGHSLAPRSPRPAARRARLRRPGRHRRDGHERRRRRLARRGGGAGGAGWRRRGHAAARRAGRDSVDRARGRRGPADGGADRRVGAEGPRRQGAARAASRSRRRPRAAASRDRAPRGRRARAAEIARPADHSGAQRGRSPAAPRGGAAPDPASRAPRATGSTATSATRRDPGEELAKRGIKVVTRRIGPEISPDAADGSRGGRRRDPRPGVGVRARGVVERERRHGSEPRRAHRAPGGAMARASSSSRSEARISWRRCRRFRPTSAPSAPRSRASAPRSAPCSASIRVDRQAAGDAAGPRRAWGRDSTLAAEEPRARPDARCRGRTSPWTASPPSTGSCERYVDEKAFPGAVLAIGRRGRLAHLRPSGSSPTRPDAPPVATDTIYDIASLTKVVVTTTLAMAMVDEKRLDLDAPVQGYLPKFQGPGKEKVTVRHLLDALLRHRLVGAALQGGRRARRRSSSGSSAMPLVYGARGRDRSTAISASCCSARSSSESSGRPLLELAHERLLEPLGLRSYDVPPFTGAFLERIAPTEIDPASGRPLHGDVHDENAFALGGVAPHAGLFSTASDLAKFAQMLLWKGRLRSPADRLADVGRAFTKRAGSAAGLVARARLGHEVRRAAPRPGCSSRRRRSATPASPARRSGSTRSASCSSSCSPIACIRRARTTGSARRGRRSTTRWFARSSTRRRLVRVGLDRVAAGEAEALAALTGKRLGLLSHAASVTVDGRQAIDVLRGPRAERREALLARARARRAARQPERRWRAEPMPRRGLPVISLYGERTQAVARGSRRARRPGRRPPGRRRPLLHLLEHAAAGARSGGRGRDRARRPRSSESARRRTDRSGRSPIR